MARTVTHVTEAEMERQREFIREIREMPQRPNTFHVVTYGCQMNAHDSEKIAGMLQEMGMTEAENREDAEFVIFNTCCVRDNAERRALGNVTWLKEVRKTHPNLMIAVCGCMIQEPGMAEKILKQYRFIDLAFGTSNLHRLPELLYEALNSAGSLVRVTDEDVNLKPEEFDFVIYEYNDCLGWDGNIHTYNPITYLPFNTKQGSVLMNDGTQLLTAAVAELSIGRLFKRSSNIARLVITQRSNGKTIFDIPLVDYVLMVKGHYVTDIPDQEYLDRQDDFSVAVFLEYRKAPSGEEGEFIAAQVYINGWQIVLQNSGLER